MTEIVMNYTVNPFWSWVKRASKAFVAAQEAAGRAKAAQHLSNMGYHEDAKRIMLQGGKGE